MVTYGKCDFQSLEVVQTAMTESSRIRNLQIPVRSWLGRGFWAVVDQGLFAGTNFLVGVLLARWLEPSAYGAFSTAYSVFLLVGTLHSALWIDPMLVYGASRYREQFGDYHRVLLDDHWRFSLLCLATFVGIAAGLSVVESWHLGLSFLGVAVAAPLNLYLWLMRRSAYVLLEPHLAACGGVVYLILFVGASVALLHFGWLSEGSALLAMAIAGFTSAQLIQRRIQHQVRITGPGHAVDTNTVRALHWKYGRWALVAGALSWVPGNIYFVILPAFGGLGAVAALKALMNIINPVLHFSSTIAVLFVPAFVRAKAEGRLLPSVVAALLVQFGSLAAFWLILVLAGETLMRSLYGGKYADSDLLAYLGVVGMGAAIANTFEAVLRALERPDQAARIHLVAALASLSVGVAFASLTGLRGVIVGMVGVKLGSALLFAVSGLSTVRRRSV